MLQLPVPPSVRERLGDKAALDLSTWVDARENGWRDRVLETASDRFSRTLADELSKLRAELATERVEISREIATTKSAILKWSFVFWIGQTLVITNLIGWMLWGVAPQ